MSDVVDAGVHAALASPVRQRVLDVLRSAPEPPTAQQLATELGLHVTTVRFHLEHLEQAGLVARETRHAQRRGRPGVHYRALHVDPGRARDDMIGALADALAAGSGPEASRAAGRAWALRLPVPAGSPQAAIAETFTRLGFDPEPVGETVRLNACPFRAAARLHPDVVCQVHLGLAEGLTARVGDGAVRVDLVPFVDDDRCLIRLTRPQDTAVVD